MQTRDVRATIALVAFITLFAVSISAARAQHGAACRSSITVRFNRYGASPIQAGSTIWFSGVLEGVESSADDLESNPVRIDVTDAKITFGPYTVRVPDSAILIDSTVQDWPTPRWSGSSWLIALAPPNAREAFFAGTQFALPEALIVAQGGPATWTATFRTSRPGIRLQWAWSAAVYSRFGVPGRLNAKLLSTPTDFDGFDNDDPAGTPELWKSYVIPGAMSRGAPHYVGARSETASISRCG